MTCESCIGLVHGLRMVGCSYGVVSSHLSTFLYNCFQFSVPSNCDDHMIEVVSQFRSKGRLPVRKGLMLDI